MVDLTDLKLDTFAESLGDAQGALQKFATSSERASKSTRASVGATERGLVRLSKAIGTVQLAGQAGGRLFGGRDDTTGIQARFAKRGSGIGGSLGGIVGGLFGPFGKVVGQTLGSFLGGAAGSLLGRGKARRERERQRREQLNALFDDVDRQLAKLSGNGVFAVKQLIDSQKEAVQTATSLRANASQLAKLRLLHDKQLAKSFEQLTRSQLDQVRGLLSASQLEAAQSAVGFNEIKNAVQERIALDRQLARSLQQAGESLLRFREGLNFSKFSTLKPVEQLEQARRAFESISRAARLGDAKAIAGFQGSAERFLNLSRQVNASSTAFANDFANVNRASDLVQQTAERQSGLIDARADAAQTALDAGASAQTLGLLREYLTQTNANFVTSADLQSQIRDAMAEGNQILFDGFSEMVTRLSQSNQILERSEGLTREQLEEQLRVNTRTAA